MENRSDVFLSYSHNDRAAAATLHGQLERRGLSVFHDVESIREGDLWLDELQKAVDACGAFVVLVGRDGVRRWIGAETQVALNRYFGPHEEAERLPIFPILLGETGPETLPAFLRLFQATPWNGTASLPRRLLDQIRERTIVAGKIAAFEGCPFVGLAAFRIDQAHLFFGRQKETLGALACFFDIRPSNPPVRWLEINGNSGSGKSSLMQAGLLPLVDQGWLWRPQCRYEDWTRIGPMMPGERPVEMLAESLARAWNVEMADVSGRLQSDGDAALVHWLRSRKEDGTAFLLAIDQFEELFTFADADERRRFDRLLAAALEDPECPLFISTVRSDFLDRFAEKLPRLVAVRNRLARPWTLAPIGDEALREVIADPARLAGLDVGSVQEVMVDQARDEPGALPLVENALHYLWEQREGNRLSGKLFTDQGGLAGILSRSADALLDGLGRPQRDQALELLFGLVQVDPDGRRHTRRRLPLDEAIAVAGGSEVGWRLLNRLAGERARDGGHAEGPLRLITISEEEGRGASEGGRWVNLIHEMLIRSKDPDAGGRPPQPYWPTLWTYIKKNEERAARHERLKLMAREWKDRKSLSRLFGLAGWSSLFGFRGLAAPKSLEHRYLRWSQGRAMVEAIVLALILVFGGVSVYWWAGGVPFEAVPERWAYIFGRELPVPALVEVPPGAFNMESKWSPDEQPIHPVVFSQPICFGKTEVTFREWDACVAWGACDRYRPTDQGWGRETRPVIYVSWDDAQHYVAWLSGKIGRDCRLPSEAEWEYAARAGTTTSRWWGNDITPQNANYRDSNIGKTTEVGSYPESPFKLYDMLGNVWEWVEDCWNGSYNEAPEDGKAWCKGDCSKCDGHVQRGGAWGASPDLVRSASRVGDYRDRRDSGLGFRVVCSSPCSVTNH